MLVICDGVLLMIDLVSLMKVYLLVRENKRLMLQCELIMKQYDALGQQIEAFRRLRHDICDYLYTLERTSEQTEKSATKIQYYCGDYMIDFAIRDKVCKGRLAGIAVSCIIECVSIGRIDRMDMLGLIYNVFNNAAEACEKVDRKKRWIRFCIYSEGCFVCMDCENAKHPDISLGENNRTIKEDKINHGIGREVISDIVNKYRGTLQIIDKKESYQIQIRCVKQEKCKEI